MLRASSLSFRVVVCLVSLSAWTAADDIPAWTRDADPRGDQRLVVPLTHLTRSQPMMNVTTPT
jgi:hypothetical protein